MEKTKIDDDILKGSSQIETFISFLIHYMIYNNLAMGNESLFTRFRLHRFFQAKVGTFENDITVSHKDCRRFKTPYQQL